MKALSLGSAPTIAINVAQIHQSVSWSIVALLKNTLEAKLPSQPGGSIQPYSGWGHEQGCFSLQPKSRNQLPLLWLSAKNHIILFFRVASSPPSRPKARAELYLTWSVVCGPVCLYGKVQWCLFALTTPLPTADFYKMKHYSLRSSCSRRSESMSVRMTLPDTLIKIRKWPKTPEWR